VTPAGTPEVPPDRRSRLRRIALDVTPLRVSRDFRLLWGGGFISELGSQFARIAVYVQVTELTGSAAAVGVVGLTGLLGIFLGTLVGGSFIDAHDRRRTLMLAQVAHTASSAILLGGAIYGHPPVWLIYLASALHAFVSSVDAPTRSAMTPRLVGKELMPSAVALNQVLWQTVGIAGSALGGLLIARFGYGTAYAIDLATYGALFFAAYLMHPMPPDRAPGSATGWAAVKEGFAFVRRNRLIQSTFVIDLIAMIFGMPQALFTFLAITQFHRGPEVVGLLFAAPAVGAFMGALTAGWVKNVRRQGTAVIWAVVAWGAAITAFGLVGAHLVLALFFLALAGAADVISAIFRNTITQLETPDSLRGRMSQIFILVVAGGPRLGDFEAGLVATWFTPTISVVSGGLACIVGAGVVSVIYPELRHYRVDHAT
jgi:predicted MFS family arabinose efflux permease